MKVLVVDDHFVFREGLRTLLATVSEVESVDEAGTVADAVAAARRLRPDVVLMDVQLPDGSGLDATRQIAETVPGTRVVMLTMFRERDHVARAIDAGACGFLPKEAGPEEIVRSLHAVHSGQFVLGAGVATSPRDLFRDPAPRPFPELSDRELEILDLIAAGVDNAGIARRWGLSVKTVRNHASNIYLKLRVEDRAHAIVLARDAGLGRDPDTLA
jgi:DNA-binding NarL/FixJ family response regulator